MSLPPAVPGSPDGAWRGGRISERVRCVLAPNPGPMTLDGTNTYVIAEPGSPRAVVVDPGPDDPAHLDAVLAVLAEQEQRVAVVLLTHSHADHSAGAASFAALAGCGVRALDPARRIGEAGLAGGDTVAVDGLVIEVMDTPGHTADSASLVLRDEPGMLTGDTVLGRGTTVVAHPDGRLGDYLASLETIEQVASRTPQMRLLPGHGPAGAPLALVAGLYRAHRAARLEQVVEAVAGGAVDADGVVAHVYADVERTLWPAARLSVLAQLDYLLEAGRLARTESGLSAPVG
jgi:glyoxylase-like metal-dependent hydrolase (beta-lactamase superfamily II)